MQDATVGWVTILSILLTIVLVSIGGRWVYLAVMLGAIAAGAALIAGFTEGGDE